MGMNMMSDLGHDLVRTDVDLEAQEELGMAKGDTVAKLHAIHVNEINRHVHVVQTTKISCGEKHGLNDY